jgi:hypothetical protein
MYSSLISDRGRGLPSRSGFSPVFCDAAVALLLAAGLAGCAAGSAPYPYFERIEIVALAPAAVEETDVAPSAGQSAAAGATAGAMGALMTGTVMSLACGPFFAVCFAGTGAAALGGATVGAVLGGSIALSEEESERVSRYLEDLQQVRNLSEELAAAVSAQLPADRLAAPGTADAQLGLQVQGLRASPGFGDSLSFWAAAKATLNRGVDRENPRQAWKEFACTTKPLPLEDWLSGDNAGAAQELDRCIEELAAEVITALKEPGSEPDPGLDPAAAMGLGNNSGRPAGR